MENSTLELGELGELLHPLQQGRRLFIPQN